jgi:cysteine synthase B
VGSVQVAERRKRGEPAVIVTILCDSGDKYLSERFWNEG